MPEGEYNLVLYVDDLEEVSELDEINNKVLARVPITIEAPNEPPTADVGDFQRQSRTPHTAVSFRQPISKMMLSPTPS